MVTVKWMGKWFCDNPKTVKKLYTHGIKGITKVLMKIKNHRENVTGPELEKTANVVFIDLLKSNKRFIAESTETIKDPTDTGKRERPLMTSNF